MIAWRLLKTRHVHRALAGEGARRYAGRWHSAGTRVVYCSAHASLAVLEVLVRLDAAAPLAGYSLLEVTVPDDAVTHLTPDALPAGWAAIPAPLALRAVGDAWAASGRSLALAVPSAVVPQEHNYLLNPAHPAFSSVTIRSSEPFTFDARLVG